MKQLVLRSWRTMEAEPHGLMVWFDPTREQLKLFELEPSEIDGVGECCEEDDQYGLTPSNDLPGAPPGEDLPF